MELTYQSPMLMPAAYAVIPEDEMTYIEGGAAVAMPATEQVVGFALNVVINSIRMLGRGALNSAINGMQEMHDDGMSIYGSVRYFWDGQNTRGKVSTVVMGSFAGFYAYLWARQTINTIVSIYKEVKAAYEQVKADNSAEQAAASVIPDTTLAVA